MRVEESKKLGLRIFHPDYFEDFRGQYIETYNYEKYKKFIDINFIQDDISISTKGVLRGVHGDNETWKLISCLHGKFYFVVVNYDNSSDKFREWESFTLSSENMIQVLVPPKYGNGHFVLTDTAIFSYKQSTYYDVSKQFTIRWNDPVMGIWWPTKHPILSQRDEGII